MNETINQSHCIMPFRGRWCRDNHDMHAILEIKGEDQAVTIEPVKLPDQAAVKFLEKKKKEVSESKEQE